MNYFRIRPGEHKVRDTEFARFLRRHLNDPELFTCFNSKTGEWFLAYWVLKDQGVACDVSSLGVHPVGSRELVRNLEATRKSASWEDLKRVIVRSAKAEYEQEIEEAEERQDVQNWVQKKTGSEIPVLF